MSARVSAALMIATAIPVLCAIDQPVQTESGRVSGVTSAGITSFKGIPFAAPPVGDLRWKAPRPPASWQGVRRADQFGTGCFQNKSGAFGPWSAEYIAKNAMEGGSSEDCLYLNVWTGASKPGEKRPVFVWIYGGGFNSGSGDVPVYDGAGLASKGLVTVTFNYRVGIFGFFAHPELTNESGHNSSGNYALLDMIAALKWVRKNIAAFGGDSANVTIAGQSAGAFAVNYLMASPLAKGLFERAIAESGGAFNAAPSLKDAEAGGVRLAETLGAKSLADLRAIPAGKLQQSSARYRGAAIVDGYVVPDDVFRIFASGHQNDVPLLTGWNADDGVSFGPAPKAEVFRAQAQRTYGNMADAFLKVFPASTDEEAAASQKAAVRDPGFAWQNRTWARLESAAGKSKVYLYYFDRTAPGTPEQTRYGAFHSSEIPYARNTLNRWDRPWTPADRKLSEEMSAYWVNFAKTGDPNGPGLPKWPAFSGSNQQSMRLGEVIEVILTPDKEKLDFLDEFNAKRRQSN